MKTLLQNNKTLQRIIFALSIMFVFIAPAMNAQTLVGWWPMDSNVQDTSGNGNNGTTAGSPTWSTGVLGYAVNLNGSSQYITVPDNATLDITSGITLAAWIKPDVQATQYIIRKGIQSTTDGYELSLANGGKVFFRLNQSESATYRVDSNTDYPFDGGTWMHIAATYDGTDMHIYINGVQDDDAPTGGPASIALNDLVLGIGAQSDGGSPLEGAIDDARVYNYALSSSEILALATVIPPIPTLNTPANNSVGQPIPTTLSWFASYSATSYQVQVSTVSDFSSTVYDQSNSSTSTSVSGLSLNTLYYWRVNATNTHGTSGWSTVWHFTTMNIPIIINNGAGYCINFNGSDNFVSVPDNDLLDFTTAITIEAWIKPTTAATTQRIMHKDNLSETIGYELFISSSGSAISQKVSFRINGSPSQRVNSTTTYPTDGTWMHVAATYDGTNMKLFINGFQEGGNVSSANIGINAALLGIGAKVADVSNPFNGAIDEVRIWNIARDSIAIRNDMCKKLTGSESGLIGYWRFSEDSGIDMADETSNGFDGILNGTISGTTHDWSGAALGDASIIDYTGSTYSDFSANIGTGSESFTAYGNSSSGAITGIQVYRVDDNANRTGTNIPGGWASVDPSRYWGVKIFGTSPVYDLKYVYTGHAGIITEANLKLAKRSNLADNNWVDAVASLEQTGDSLTLTGQTGTEYTLGSTTDPLPVELSAFSAKISKNNVLLKWRTETEVSNYGFEVQRSSQKDKWDVLGFVPGSGNSNSPKDYSFTDDKVIPGKYSYRLKQIDTDGQFSYSKTIQVNFGSAVKFELSQNYPNPFNPVTTIQFSIPQSGNVKLTVYNILGEQVAVLINEFKDSGVHTINFDAGQFNSGLYVYKLESSGFVQTRKMLLVK